MKIKTLIQLALNNLYARKKVFITMGVIVFLISTVLLCSQILNTNRYYTEKITDSETYGSWVAMYKGIDPSVFESTLETDNKRITGYSYIKDYGKIDTLQSIGKIDKADLSRCGIHIIEGHIDVNDDDLIHIVVPESFFEDHSIAHKLDQKMTMSFTDYQGNKKNIDTLIIGVYEIKYENKEDDISQYFPTIIALNDIGVKYSTNLVADASLYNTNIFAFNNNFGEIILNPKGHDVGIMADYKDLTVHLRFMVLCTVIGAFIVIGITFSSIKSRAKELTLIRAIGGTKIQLAFMIGIEMMLIYILVQILSILASMGICYIVMNVTDSRSFINPTISFENIYTCSFYSLVIVFIGFFVPMLYTLKSALTGSFDHKEFQYFQIRYRKLRRQSTLQLAYRSLMVKKRFTFILITILTVCLYFCGSWYYIDTFESVKKNETLAKTQDMYSYCEVYDRENEIDKSLIADLQVLTQDIQIMPKYEITFNENENRYSVETRIGVLYVSMLPHNLEKRNESDYIGRLPEKDNEVFLTLESYPVYDEEKEENKSVKLNIGDEVIVNDKNMQVVGIAKNTLLIIEDQNSTLHYSNGLLNEYSIYVNEKMYGELTNESSQKLNYLKVFTTKDNHDIISKIINNYKEQKPKVHISDSIETINSLKNFIIDKYNDKITQVESLAILVISLSLLSYVFINYYDIITNKKEYALLRIIGTTRKDIYILQSKKAFIICLYASIFSFVCLISLFNLSNLPNILLAMSVIPIFIIISSLILVPIYTIPMYILLKQDPLDIISIEE